MAPIQLCILANWCHDLDQKHLVYPALFNGHHNIGYLYNLIAAPPRLLFIYVFVILAVSVILACIQYHSFECFQPNAIFSVRAGSVLTG
jgi:hypothetical protein